MEPLDEAPATPTLQNQGLAPEPTILVEPAEAEVAVKRIEALAAQIDVREIIPMPALRARCASRRRSGRASLSRPLRLGS